MQGKAVLAGKGQSALCGLAFSALYGENQKISKNFSKTFRFAPLRCVLAMCNGQEELAEFLFEMVDWQSPETLKSELLATYEIDFCPVCKKYYFMQGEQIPCPICGANPEEIENADTESEC